ncbi:MAG TPA: hypothetical protein VFS59_15560 [Gemmatimonadaceae bacterium]|nr:hypothetical protein [Gemmatimonadaceae bacterium]
MPSLGSVFLFLAVLGGVLVVFQAVGGMLGLVGHDVEDGHTAHLPDHTHPDSAFSAFNFTSLRAIATGICFTGIGGLLALRTFGGLAATGLALLLGLTLYLFVAFVMRGFSRLEADHSVHPLRAVGLQATVSLPIPARGDGPGKVTLVVGGRHVEWPAVQSESAPAGARISSGTTVQVIDAADDTTLTVVPLTGAS